MRPRVIRLAMRPKAIPNPTLVSLIQANLFLGSHILDNRIPVSR
jgi:hypothetical protein